MLLCYCCCVIVVVLLLLLLLLLLLFTLRWKHNLDWRKYPCEIFSMLMSMDHGLIFFGISKIFCHAVFLWRHQIKIHDVIVGKKYFFSKGDHVIYRWKADVTLIQNHLRTMVWKWSPGEIFWFEFGPVTSRDRFKIQISLQNFIFRPLFLYDSPSA